LKHQDTKGTKNGERQNVVNPIFILDFLGALVPIFHKTKSWKSVLYRPLKTASWKVGMVSWWFTDFCYGFQVSILRVSKAFFHSKGAGL